MRDQTIVEHINAVHKRINDLAEEHGKLERMTEHDVGMLARFCVENQLRQRALSELLVDPPAYFTIWGRKVLRMRLTIDAVEAKYRVLQMEHDRRLEADRAERKRRAQEAAAAAAPGAEPKATQSEQLAPAGQAS